MTTGTPSGNRPTPRDAAQARFEVEALFLVQKPRSKAADVDIVVTRRRIASADICVDGNDVAEVVVGEVRASRTFKVGKQQEVRQDGQEFPLNALLEPQVGGAASKPSEVMQARRRRRRLNGYVTIIRLRAGLPLSTPHTLLGSTVDSMPAC